MLFDSDVVVNEIFSQQRWQEYCGERARAIATRDGRGQRDCKRFEKGASLRRTAAAIGESSLSL